MDDMHTRLRAARKLKYKTMAEAAERLGLTYTTYASHENGQSKYDLDQARIYAAAFDTTVEHLFGLDDDISVPEMSSKGSDITIPVLGIAEAGRFRASDFTEEFEPITAPHHPAFEGRPHIAYKVAGDSMDRAGIYNGDLVTCIPAFDAPVPRVGDIVVVERVRSGGHFVETTVKRVSETRPPRKLVLCPESSNPIHKPIVFTAADHKTAQETGEDVRMKGIVVQVVRDLFRR